jgi:hypothetical protein
MCPNRNAFTTYKPYSGDKTKVANDTFAEPVGIGKVVIEIDDGILELDEVRHVPSLDTYVKAACRTLEEIADEEQARLEQANPSSAHRLPQSKAQPLQINVTYTHNHILSSSPFSNLSVGDISRNVQAIQTFNTPGLPVAPEKSGQNDSDIVDIPTIGLGSNLVSYSQLDDQGFGLAVSETSPRFHIITTPQGDTFHAYRTTISNVYHIGEHVKIGKTKQKSPVYSTPAIQLSIHSWKLSNSRGGFQ